MTQSSWNTCSFQTDMLPHILGLVHITIPSHWGVNSYTSSASQVEPPPANKPLLTLQDWVKQPVSLWPLWISIASSLAGIPTWTISISKVGTVSYPPLYLCTSSGVWHKADTQYTLAEWMTGSCHHPQEVPSSYCCTQRKTEQALVNKAVHDRTTLSPTKPTNNVFEEPVEVRLQAWKLWKQNLALLDHCPDQKNLPNWTEWCWIPAVCKNT